MATMVMGLQAQFEAVKNVYLKEIRRSLGDKRANGFKVVYEKGWVVVDDGQGPPAHKVRLQQFAQMAENVRHHSDFESPAHRVKDSGAVVISIPGIVNSPSLVWDEPSFINRQWKITYREKVYRLLARDGELVLEKIVA